jgi:hypothetical protein
MAAPTSKVLLRVPEFRIMDQEGTYASLVRDVARHYTEGVLSSFLSAVSFENRRMSAYGSGASMLSAFR